MKYPNPKNWYAFRWNCQFHTHSSCNLYSEEEMHGCLRPDRKGNPRKEYDPVTCKTHVCPILKGKYPPDKKQMEFLATPKESEER